MRRRSVVIVGLAALLLAPERSIAQQLQSKIPRVGILTVAERLRARVEQVGIAHASSPASDHVTLSLGAAATLPRRESTPASLIAMADKAMYQAKHEGRNRVARAV